LLWVVGAEQTTGVINGYRARPCFYIPSAGGWCRHRSWRWRRKRRWGRSGTWGPTAVLALINVKDLKQIPRSESLTIASVAFSLRGIGVKGIVASAAVSRVVHYATEIVVGITFIWVTSSIVCRPDVAVGVFFPLGYPRGIYVLPLHVQVRPMSMKVASGIRPLLLMVHANKVSDLMDHTANIVHAVAEAQVDPTIGIRSRITKACHVAAA